MGSKGSTPQTTQQSQTYTPNPYVAGAGQQAISGAEYAAGQPFQMPVAPLAPFSPYQNQAMAGVGQAVGMAQPYFGAGAGYLAGSAAPITGQDVAGYYNPMAGNVMAGMQDIFGQQMRETTGKLTQQAGGVGADRIAVGQANLARQQGLAGGQTLAGLYYPALQAAQQQKQMMAGAGYGLGQMGPAAQAAQLQSLQAQMGAGGMQQQLAQQYLNNLYQNRLAQIGYQFQTPQYLAGIAGGLAPAMGGTTQGQAQQWAAQPSLFSQLLGLGTAGVGAYGALGGFGGGSSPMSLGSYGGTGLGGYGGFYERGGHVPTSMKGGGTPPPLPKPPDPIYSPKPMSQPGATGALPPGGLSTEDALAQSSPFFEWYGGTPAVNQAQIASMTTPRAGMPSVPSVPLPSSQSTSGKGFSPFTFLNSIFSKMPGLNTIFGGQNPMMAADPFGVGAAASLGRANGGAADNPFTKQFGSDLSPVPYIQLQPGSGEIHNTLKFSQPSSGGSTSGGSHLGQIASAAAEMLPLLMTARGGGVSPFDIGQPFQKGGSSFDDRFTGDEGPTFEQRYMGEPDQPTMPETITPVAGEAPRDALANSMAALKEPPLRDATAPGPSAPDEMPMGTGDTGPQPGYTPAAYRGQPPMSASDYQMPASQRPYPGAQQQDWGTRMSRSPWLALMEAGAKIATTPGPVGTAIGSGVGTFAKSLEGQRKALQSEEDINLKAQHLYQMAQQHLDQYNKMTPYQQEEVRLREEALKTERWSPTYSTTEDGHPILYDRRSGRTIDSVTGSPIKPDQKITSTRGAGSTGGVSRWRHDAWLAAHPGDEEGALNYASGRKQMSDAEIAKSAISMAQRDAQHDTEALGDYQGYVDKRRTMYEQQLRHLQQPAAPTVPAPQIGDKKQFKQGVGVWNGNEWIPEGP